MRMRKLGRTSVSVTELGLGTAPLGDLFDRIEDDEASAIVSAAWDGGVRYFDTSPGTGAGSRNTASAGLSTARTATDLVISTKIGRVLRRPLKPGPIKDQWIGGLNFETVYDYGYDG